MSMILMLLATALLMSGCADGGSPESSTEPESSVVSESSVTDTSSESAESIEQLSIQLVDRDGWIRAEWEGEYIDGCTYEVTSYSRIESTEGEVSLIKIDETTTTGRSIALTDRIAYYYQEMKIDSFSRPIELVVKVRGIVDDKTVAEGESSSIGLIDFFPPEEGPKIGEDIQLSDITLLELYSNGTSTEMIYNFTVNFQDGRVSYYGSYFNRGKNKEVEKDYPESYGKKLLDVISRGSLYRDYVMDPEIQMLDGGDRYYRIEWEGMKNAERRYYRLRLDEEDSELLEDLLRNPRRW